MNHYFELDLLNESVNVVHKTELNDLSKNQTDLALEFTGLKFSTNI